MRYSLLAWSYVKTKVNQRTHIINSSNGTTYTVHHLVIHTSDSCLLIQTTYPLEQKNLSELEELADENQAKLTEANLTENAMLEDMKEKSSSIDLQRRVLPEVKRQKAGWTK